MTALPAGWRWARLGDICSIDKNTNGADGPIIGLEHIESETGRILDDASAVDYKITTAFDQRHVLYGKLRPYLNKVALPDFEGRCTTEIVPLLPADGCDREWLGWALRRPETVEAAMGEKTGTRMPRANMTHLLRLTVPLPPLSEQHRIAAILRDQLDTVRRAREAAQARLEAARALPAAFLCEAFHHIMPLATDQDRDAPPPGWSWRRLSSLARLESGHTPSRYHPEWWGGDVPWIALPDIRALDGKIAHETVEYTNEAGIANSSARVLPKGTVVLSRTASVGFVTIMGRPMATSQDFVNWVCGPDLNPDFLAYLFRASRAYIMSLSSGAVHQTVYVPTVKAFEVCVSPIEEQARVARSLSDRMICAESMKARIGQQLSAIDSLPPRLLQSAFSGNL
jgi:type I restriction enzyme S subunit